jgi:hypothetical protein
MIQDKESKEEAVLEGIVRREEVKPAANPEEEKYLSLSNICSEFFPALPIMLFVSICASPIVYHCFTSLKKNQPKPDQVIERIENPHNYKIKIEKDYNDK